METSKKKLFVLGCAVLIVGSGIYALMSMGPPRATAPEEAIKAAEKLAKEQSAAQQADEGEAPTAPVEPAKHP